MGPRLIPIREGRHQIFPEAVSHRRFLPDVGEDDDDDSAGSFNNASVWARISVVAAGPVFNFIMAFVCA
mgnify:CR=1 FL=1